MEKKYDLITSGYVSMDHLIQVSSPISIGYTSLIENQDNTKIYYGGCGLNIAVAVNQLGFKALPVLRVGDIVPEVTSPMIFPSASAIS